MGLTESPKKLINSLKAPHDRNRIFYDDEIGGFGVRITANGVISFVLDYWTRSRQRRHTIGRHPELNATAAPRRGYSAAGRYSSRRRSSRR